MVTQFATQFSGCMHVFMLSFACVCDALIQTESKVELAATTGNNIAYNSMLS